MKRAAAIALLSLVLPACGNLGLDGAPPLNEAEHAPPPALEAAVHARMANPDDQVVVDGRLWVPWGLPETIDAGQLRSVGSARGRTIYARSWDRSPYDQLFTRTDGEWQRYAPVIGRSGGTAAAAH